MSEELKRAFDIPGFCEGKTCIESSTNIGAHKVSGHSVYYWNRTLEEWDHSLISWEGGFY